jgi:hypothetical protein
MNGDKTLLDFASCCSVEPVVIVPRHRGHPSPGARNLPGSRPLRRMGGLLPRASGRCRSQPIRARPGAPIGSILTRRGPARFGGFDVSLAGSIFFVVTASRRADRVPRLHSADRFLTPSAVLTPFPASFQEIREIKIRISLTGPNRPAYRMRRWLRPQWQECGLG